MPEDKIEDLNVSPEERAALEVFFKNLNLAFRSATMYFREHPSFAKNIASLKKALEKVSTFRVSLNIGVTQYNLLLEGRYIKKRQFRELAMYLHQRKIKSLRISAIASSESLRDFVARLAVSLKAIQEGKPPNKVVGAIRGIEIEELDYSPLLATEGEPASNIWNILLTPDALLSKDSLYYIADNMRDAIAFIEQVPWQEKSPEVLFENLEKIAKSLDAMSEEKARKFMESGFNVLYRMPREFLEAFLSADKCPEFKRLLSKYLNKNSLFRDIMKQLVQAKRYNRLFLSVYNNIFKEQQSAEGLAEQINAFLERDGSFKDRKKIAVTLEELLIQDSSDAFVSALYKKTLFYLTEAPTAEIDDEEIIEEYTKDFGEMRIREDYVRILMELLRIEEKISDINSLLSKIDEMIPFLFEREDLHLMRQAIELFEQKKSSLDDKKTIDALNSLCNKVCNARLLELVLSSIESIEDDADAKFIIKRIEKASEYVVDKLLKSSDVDAHRRLKEILQVIADSRLIDTLKGVVSTQASVFVIKEVIDILSRVRTEGAIRLLKEIYAAHRRNSLLVLDILKAMRLNPFKDRYFLQILARDKDYAIRREAVWLFVDIASQQQKSELVASLLGVDNFLGMKNKFLLENIDILVSSTPKEAIPYLKQFVLKRPLFFRAKRDELRIRSLEALIKVDAQEVRSMESLLLKDHNKRIKYLVLRG